MFVKAPEPRTPLIIETVHLLPQELSVSWYQPGSWSQGRTLLQWLPRTQAQVNEY